MYPVGVTDGSIHDDQITYTSIKSGITSPGRLDGSPWIPVTSNDFEYLQIRFNSPYDLSTIETQGADDGSQVTRYVVKYLNVDSTDAQQWVIVSAPGETQPWVSNQNSVRFLNDHKL